MHNRFQVKKEGLKTKIKNLKVKQSARRKAVAFRVLFCWGVAIELKGTRLEAETRGDIKQDRRQGQMVEV